MSPTVQRAIAATYMRGGTSKGVFFLASDLPCDPAERDALLLRIMGSPDGYGKQIDGMGGASSSTSKVILIAASERPDADVQYWFGQVAIDRPLIDWRGNCGNLTAAVAPFAIATGLVAAPQEGHATVRLWQAAIAKHIVARVPIHAGQVVETGDFMLDGVTFPAAEIELAFIDPGEPAADTPATATAFPRPARSDLTSAPVSGLPSNAPNPDALLPTGRALDILTLADGTMLEATLINAGNPAVFVDAASLGMTGIERQSDVNGNAELLTRCEAVRATAAVAMGLADSVEQASAERPSTPKLAFFAKPAAYTASDGRAVGAEEIDITARILSMGQLHHAMTGTGAVAIAAAAAIEGTVLSRIVAGAKESVCFGHPSGTLKVGAQATCVDGTWRVAQVCMSRSARRLMTGFVFA